MQYNIIRLNVYIRKLFPDFRDSFSQASSAATSIIIDETAGISNYLAYLST